MADTENIKTLAKTAYESKNFDQAHEYYSKLLEEDPSNANAWLMKGLAAGWKSEPQDHKLDELEVSFEKAVENGLSEEQQKEVATDILQIGEHVMEQTYEAFDEAIREHKQEDMATGEIHTARDFETKSYALEVGGWLNKDWYHALCTMKWACEIDPSTDKVRKTIEEIDKLKKHSNNNSTGYLNLGEDEMVNREGNSYGDKIERLRNDLVKMGKELDSSFSPTPIDTDEGACFVATATFGSPLHPTVRELRAFRDDVLLESRSGRAFISLYYTVGPHLSKWIERSTLLQTLSRYTLIYPAAYLVRILSE